MRETIDAVETFFAELASVEWTAVAIALAFQLARLLARSVAWRAIVQAAFPDLRIPLKPIAGAYLAGVGINAVAPARAGDAVKLVLVKNEVRGTTYTTLTPTLIVETLFDAVVASGILLWALAAGVLPAFDALPDLPSIDWSWPIDHPSAFVVVAAVWLVVIALLVVIWSRRVRDFGEQVRHGFAILGQPGRYLREVISWQVLSWACRIGTVWFFLDAFDIPTSARNVTIVLAVQSLSTLLPFTPGGIGTQQGFLLYAFRDADIARTSLVSFSVGMHIATNAFNFAVGLVALALVARTVRWKQLVGAEQDALDGPTTGR